MAAVVFTLEYIEEMTFDAAPRPVLQRSVPTPVLWLYNIPELYNWGHPSGGAIIIRNSALSSARLQLQVTLKHLAHILQVCHQEAKMSL